MPDFMFAYHGGRQPETPEEGEAMMNNWNQWLENHKDATVNPGNPVGMSKTVSSKGVEDNGGSNPLMGFSVFKANSIDEAVKIANSCPFLEMDGSIEIAEIKEM